MKPICVKCQRFYRPKRNGVKFIEMMPKDGAARPTKAGTEEPESWQPYKLWVGDLWECRGCGHLSIHGVGFGPLAERHQEHFAKECAAGNVVVLVNDC